MMWALPTEPRAGDTLTRNLRKYFADNVKISKENMKHAKKLVKDYVEDEIISYCERTSPLPLLRLEYTGSMYERLKCEAADEVDLMLILATTRLEVTVEDPGIPGFVKLKTNTNSPLRKYADPLGYLIPARVRQAWLYSLVSKAVNSFEIPLLPWYPVRLEVSSHGPAIQLDIVLYENGIKKILLSADLVPCFQIDSDNYFVAKPYEGRRFVSNPEILWRQSFSVKEKEMLTKMDRDHGCRHELLRIVKTILKKDVTTFGKLKSYHVKTAFMHYITNTPGNWTSDSSLEEHFLGFLEALQNYLVSRNLPTYLFDYWHRRPDLLEEICPKVMENMAYRLNKIKTTASRFRQTCNQILLSQKLRQYSCATQVTTDTDDKSLQKVISSLQGERRLQFLRRDYRGCVLELFWIVKTVVKRDGILYLLSSVDVDRAFHHYVNTHDSLWIGDNSLGEHFLGFMSVLHGLLIAGHLLEDVSEGNVALVANRCARIINSEDERNKLLGGEMTWVWPWAQADDSLTRKLRHYSNNHVKVGEADMAYTRMLVKDYVEDRVMRYCRQKSKLPILKVEYSGSAYERLETDPADKVKVMVVLKTTKSWLWGQEVSTERTSVPGYVYLKTRWNSKFCRYADPERYLDPERFRSGWLYSLVEQAVENFRDSSPYSGVHLAVYQNGSSVELDVIKNGTEEILLTVDLIPCFEAGYGDYFVAKPYTGRRCVSSPELLWRQSFSLQEKEMLENVDSGDSSNGHELFRIVKTIVNSEPGPLGRLSLYHLKTAFMHYISERRHKWSDKNALAYHFLGFLGKLQSSLQNGNLPHFWLSGVNILDDIDQELLIHMAIRLERILNSRAEMNKILLASETYRLPNSHF